MSSDSPVPNGEGLRPPTDLWACTMWTFLIVVAAIIITARVTDRVITARVSKSARETEERARNERKKAHFALEAELLSKGLGEVWPNLATDTALRLLCSLGNVKYLVWLLNCEPLYRDHRGQGDEQYPPDWELRRGFVFLRDHNICRGCAKHSSEGIILDCHHIKPIAEFSFEETGIHSINNLVTLCPHCHAGQHLNNRMLNNRAARLSMSNQHLSRSSGKQSIQKSTFAPPQVIDVQHSDKGVEFDRMRKELVESPPKPKQEGLRLEDMEAKLRTTTSPILKRFLETQIAAMKAEIRAKCGVNSPKNGPNPESAKRAIAVVKRERAGRDTGLRSVPDASTRNVEQKGVGRFSNPPVMGMPRYAGATDSGRGGRPGGGTLTSSVIAYDRSSDNVVAKLDPAKLAKTDINAKSISNGLEWVEKRISDTKHMDADQIVEKDEEEEKYGHCDYCDKEILIDTFYKSDRGTYLCHDCYSSTWRKE